MPVTVRTFIADVAIEHVFARLIDVEAWPELIDAIDAVEKLTPGPVSVGTCVRETRTMFGRTAHEVMTFAEIDAPHGFVLTAENHGMAYRTEHAFREKDGGVEVAIIFDGRPVTRINYVMAPIMKFFMSGMIKRALQEDMDCLARRFAAVQPSSDP